MPTGRRPTGVAALLRKHPVTVFYAVPTFYAAFLASPQRSADVAKSRFAAAFPPARRCPRKSARRWSERYGVDILDGHRLDRDAAHLIVTNRAWRDEIRHHRKAGAGLRRSSSSAMTGSR